MLHVIPKYLRGQIGKMLVAASILLGIALLGGLLTDVLNRVSRGQFPAGLLFSQIGLRLPWALTILLPLASFLALLLSYARLYRTSELAVLKSGGFAEWRLVGPAMAIGIPLCVALLLLGLFLAPAARRVAAEMIDRANQQVLVAGLEPGRFFELSKSRSVVYIGRIDGWNLENVLLIRRGEDGSESVVSGLRGRIEQLDAGRVNVLHLENGERVDVDGKNTVLQRAAFERAELVLPETLHTPPNSADAIEYRDLQAFWPPENAAEQAEFARRIAPSIQVILLMLLAIPLARAPPRDMRYDRIIIGFLLFVTYSIATYALIGMVSLDRAPAWSALIGIHALFASVVVLAYTPILSEAWRGRRIGART